MGVQSVMKSRTPIRRSLSVVGHRLREIDVHRRRLFLPRRALRILVLPGGPNNGSSSGLRGWQIAEELKCRGYRVVVVPHQLGLFQRQRIYRRERPDVVLMQKCRHPFHRPHFYPNSIHILDLDDADFVDPSLRQEMEQVARTCHGAIAGSRYISNWLRQYCNRVEIIWTGSHLVNHVPPTRPSERGDVIGWATSDVLGYPAEAKLMREALEYCAKERRFRLRIQGGGNPNEIREYFHTVVASGSMCEIIGFLPYKKFIKSLESLSVGLAPLVIGNSSYSAGKSFGKVLGYLAADVPVVASNAADHALFFRSGENGYLVDDVEDFAQSVITLLDNHEARDSIADAARMDFATKLSLGTAADRVSGFITSLVEEFH